MTVNIGQSVRNAFVHATAWWIKVADPAPADLNIARCLRASQLLRNMITWFCANDVARETVMAFYGSDGKVDPAFLPAIMALMYTACQVTGMPNWTHAALEAGDIQQNATLLARQAEAGGDCKTKLHKYMNGRLGQLATDALAAMRDLQDRDFQAADYFGTVSVRELELLKALRQLTAVATRLLIIERPASEKDVHDTLQRFIESCAAQPEAMIIPDAESMATKLAEQMADTMTMVQQRLHAAEERAKAAQAAANGAEAIAEAAERQASAAVKAAAAPKPPRAPSTTKLVAAIDDLGRRMQTLEGGVAKDVSDLMSGMVALDKKMGGLRRALDTTAAIQDTREVADEALAAVASCVDRLAALEAALKARAGALETVTKSLETKWEARAAALEAKIEYLTAQAQAQFWSQWHALQMQWSTMCPPGGSCSPAPAAAKDSIAQPSTPTVAVARV